MNKLKYPNLVVENSGQLPMLFRVVRSPSEFVDWFSVPKKGTYTSGQVFDSAGRIYAYEGDASRVMVSGWLHTLLENIVVPSLVFKVMSLGVYFGPRVVQQYAKVPIDEFQREMLNAISQYEKNAEVERLAEQLDNAGKSHSAKIGAVRHWVFSSPAIKF